MDSPDTWTVALDEAEGYGQAELGGKAIGLARAVRAGFPVPEGYCLTTAAYRLFRAHNRLDLTIDVELGRKPLEDMRWEELWDAALRIRSAFLTADIPAELRAEILAIHEAFGAEARLVVRSSAPGEDAPGASFAGLHESVIDVRGGPALLDAVRLVWASLWSDGALLYRRELNLNPTGSDMAVLVQELQVDGVSGVAFGKDPRDLLGDLALVEAVPGLCRDLVDGAVDPDRWTLERGTGIVIEWSPASRDPGGGEGPLLNDDELNSLWQVLMRLEALLTLPVDLEWSGRGKGLKVLQARPITAPAAQVEEDRQRRWYLTLRPAAKRLARLSRRVSETLIPELEALGRRWAAEPLGSLDAAALAETLNTRLSELKKWRAIYWDDFIPFAHGVRQLGRYYNDAVKPQDPFEFTALLEGENLLALQRNRGLLNLAARLLDTPVLRDRLQAAAADGAIDDREAFDAMLKELAKLPGGESFVEDLSSFLGEHLDVSYRGRRVGGHPGQVMASLLEMTRTWQPRPEHPRPPAPRAALEARLFAAVGPERRAEAEEVLAIGRLSWRLRDDDNVLLGRLEAQFLRALHEAAARLCTAGRLSLDPGMEVEEADAQDLAQALRNGASGPVLLPARESSGRSTRRSSAGERPRQLLGQPAAAGLATGLVRIVETVEDLGRFGAGEVMVCQAIEPTMTHLVPLASAIVERRGGMLIHGAIIARELGIPCVNGITDVLDWLKDGDLVTVDGHLGIVSVGTVDFDIEGVELPPSS